MAVAVVAQREIPRDVLADEMDACGRATAGHRERAAGVAGIGRRVREADAARRDKVLEVDRLDMIAVGAEAADPAAVGHGMVEHQLAGGAGQESYIFDAAARGDLDDAGASDLTDAATHHASNLDSAAAREQRAGIDDRAVECQRAAAQN